jgi:hypothetical protein
VDRGKAEVDVNRSSEQGSIGPVGVLAMACRQMGTSRNTGSPSVPTGLSDHAPYTKGNGRRYSLPWIKLASPMTSWEIVPTGVPKSERICDPAIHD